MPDPRSSQLLSLMTSLLVALGLALVFGGPSFAQDPTEVFGEVIDVRVVNLEVVVTEKGERVTGLGPEDFELLVDKQSVPIEYFTEVADGRAASAAPDTQATTLPALAPGQPVGTSYLVFIDEFFTIKRDRDRVLDAMSEQLANLTSQDRMAVVAYDGKAVEMLSNWSSDVPELTRVLQQAKGRKSLGLQRLSERRVFDSGREVAELANEDPRQIGADQRIDIEQEQMASRISTQVENAVRAATATLRGFAGPPGRKIMMLLSGGWPSDPLRWVLSQESGFFDDRGIPRGQELLGELSSTANRLSYTIYPVDVAGITYQPSDAARSGTTVSARSRGPSLVREQEEEASLLQLAADTGGRAFLNSVRVSALEQAVADTRSYYWLGFTPTWQGDDTEHDIEVKVNGKGMKVRSRESYSDLSRSTEVTMMVESALLFGEAPGTTPLEIEVGRGKRAGFGKRDVPLTIQIPLHELTFLPASNGFATQVELRVAVLDAEGNTADEIPVIPFSFEAKRNLQPGETAVKPHDVTLRIRNREHTLVVSIYDVASGKILTGSTRVAKR